MFKKIFLVIGILVVAGFLITGATVAAALLGSAQKCSTTAGQVRSEQELFRLIESKGLTISDAEATALVQKYLVDKIKEPEVCFTPGLAHLSGKIKAGSLNPSFYVSTGIDLTGTTPKTRNLDIRVGSVPNLFLFSPVEKMIEGIINNNLSQARMQEKYSVEFNNGTATIKKLH